MKKDTIKNKIQEKLSNRKIVPSENAWNRLESMLDEDVIEHKNKVVSFRKWFWIAASLLLVFSVIYLIDFDTQKPQIVKESKRNIETDFDLDKNDEKVEIVENQVEKAVEDTNLENTEKIKTNELAKQEIQKLKEINTQNVAKTTKIEEVKNKNIEIELLKEDEFISQDSLVLDDAGFKDFKEIQLVENKTKEKPKSYVNPDLLLFSVENEVYHERNPNQKTTKIAYIIYDEINKQLSK